MFTVKLQIKDVQLRKIPKKNTRSDMKIQKYSSIKVFKYSSIQIFKYLSIKLHFDN